MIRICCIVLSAFLLTACLGKSNDEMMPKTEVATVESSIPSTVGTVQSPKKDLSKHQASSSKKQVEKTSKLSSYDITVYAKLETFAQEFIIRSNRYLMPNKARPTIKKNDGKVTITYIEIDADSMELELLSVNSKHFKHMAKMRYVEKHLQSVGIDSASAVAGEFTVISSRRVTELPRYVGSKWVH